MKKFFLSFIVFLLFCAAGYSGPLTLKKSIEPSVGFIGDTVTVCLEIEASASVPKADIVWVIDISASMGSGISNIKNNINYMTSQLASEGIDYRQGLVTYSDVYIGEPITNYGFMPSDADFMSAINGISLLSGGDIPESGLEGLLSAQSSAWRADASKTIILVTDAQVKTIDTGNGVYSLTYTAQSLTDDGITVDAICVDMGSYAPYSNPKDLPSLTGGIWLDYWTPSSDWDAFLVALGTAISTYSNVVIRDPLPPELMPVAPYGGGSYTGGQVIWTFSSVGKGQPFTVCFPSVITSAYAGFISNTAYISADNVTETASDTEYVFYPTKTATTTATPTVTATGTITVSPTITLTATITPTATPTPPVLMLMGKGTFPNPFIKEAQIVYYLTAEADVTVKVYTVSGEVVFESQPVKGLRGVNSFLWDGRNKNRKPVASGLYIYRVQAVSGRDEKVHIFGKAACLR
ncbi:MAG: VWA domain-containing protein [Candidatus Goldbacteria bacterium]|nr:VWA domain-containing protein [Candidatus Goldiibacteriota bacterium]